MKSDSLSIPEIRHKGGNQACHHNQYEHDAKDQFLTGEKGCQDQDDACREETFSAQAVSPVPVLFAAKSPWSPYAHKEIAFHFRQFVSNEEEQNTDCDSYYQRNIDGSRMEIFHQSDGGHAKQEKLHKNTELIVKMFKFTVVFLPRIHMGKYVEQDCDDKSHTAHKK